MIFLTSPSRSILYRTNSLSTFRPCFFSTSSSPSRLLFLDSETTGFGSSARMVQLAWQRRCAHTRELLSPAQCFIFKPTGFSIPLKATLLHGISTQMAQSQGHDSKHVWARFLADLKQSDVAIAHNMFFDNGALCAEVLQANDAAPSELLPLWQAIEKRCTMRMFRSCCSGKSAKLSEAYTEVSGSPPDQQSLHRADFDTEICAQLYFAILEKNKGEGGIGGLGEGEEIKI
jgi:DNA polymerase-3 subunit alpha